MARAFLKVYFDFDEKTDELSDAERARLLLAMYYYAKTGEKKPLAGNERFLFSTFKGEIDRDVAAYNAKVANGKQGGRPTGENLTETENNLTKPNETENNLTKPNETENNLNRKNKNKNKIIEDDEDEGIARAETAFGSVTLDPLIIKVQQELFGLTDNHYAALEDYRQELGDEIVSHAIDTAVGHGARSWAYVERVLSGYLSKGIKTIGEAKAADEEHRKAHSSASVRSKSSVNPFLDALQRGEFNDAG